MRKNERSVVFNDNHIPFQDKRAEKVVMKFIKRYQPDRIFINGDLADCWEISDFMKSKFITNSELISEIQQVRDFFVRLRRVAPNAQIIYIFGNHEFRFERYIAKNAPALHGLEGLSLEEQFHLKQFEVIPVNNHLRENHYRYGKLLIGHFNKVNKFGGYTAKNLMEEKGMSVIQGHTHRGGFSPKRDYASPKAGWENFCLCDLNPPYLSLPNWQLGFSEIFMDTKSGLFEVHQKMLVDYKIIYGNDIIRG